jgi:hypothetical protein
MKRKWTGLSINLDELAQAIKEFFEARSFFVKNNREVENIKIEAIPKQGVHRILEPIMISISGKPEDFEICFLAGERSRSMARLGDLTKLFGGGWLFLRGVRSEEELGKLEREFWNYIYPLIEFLSKKDKEEKT